MKEVFDQAFAQAYEGKALIADPIYQYAWFTTPRSDEPAEKTEKDLIDSPWVQRLRRIYQIQSARWVYPAAEHSRFQHSIGTMHVAGEFGRYLYPSLAGTCRKLRVSLPSINYIEEILRIAGLLHDIGHGPFGHFFDDNFLSQFRLNHEILGQKIITTQLGQIIKKIRRSPNGPFEKGEAIAPADIAFLIRMPGKSGGADKGRPQWLNLLRQLFSGIYTVDNLDYVQRDAYMTGFSLDIVDITRLRYYTFFSEEGLTLHQAGISALNRFLNARLNLYTNVYYHRTTRALDLHLQEIFRDTMNIVFPYDPAKALDRYLLCDEWQLHQTVQEWPSSKDPVKKKLGREWERLHRRQVKWKMSYATDLSIDQLHRGIGFSGAAEYEAQLRRYLPKKLSDLALRIDLATQDPRPLNPTVEGDKRINIFNPATGVTSPEPLREIYRFIPARVVHFRVFSLSHDHDQELTEAAEKVLGNLESRFPTNI